MHLNIKIVAFLAILNLCCLANSTAQLSIAANGGILSIAEEDLYTGGTLSCKYNLFDNVAVALNAGRYAFRFDNDVTSYAIPVTASLELYTNNEKVIPYGILDMGVFIVGSSRETLSKSEGMFGMAGGGGLKFMVNSQWSFHSSLKFQIIGGNGDAVLATNVFAGVGYSFR
jgi:hypothetical protein